MGYQATVLNVMLASPSDVAKERQIARGVITEWNVIHSKDRKIVLMPIGWDTHSSPEMGDRPQAIINRQLVKDCDLLLAVFWTRLGSPTGAAPSGTVEEIEEHISAGKPALIYFSATPVRMDSVDSNQYAALVRFKESCRDRGLVEEYEGFEDFRTKFSRQLAQTIIRSFSQGGTGADQAEGTRATGPVLSEAALELLSEGAKDGSGSIACIGTMAGVLVETNGRELSVRGDARSEAKWRGALEELEREGLVEDRTGKGELFFVTDAGFSAADSHVEADDSV